MSDPHAPQQPNLWQAPPAQPSYPPPPSHPTQGYPAPQGYPQPGYPALPYAQQPSIAPPGYGYPPGYGPPPGPGPAAPNPNRTGVIVSVVVAAVALVLCAGIAAVAYTVTRNDKVDNATPSTPAAAGGKQLKLVSPDTIGQWKKSASQRPAEDMNKSTPLAHPFAASYDDTKSAGRSVLLFGGTDPSIGPAREDSELRSFVAGLTDLNGGTPVTPVIVDPGMIGGQARCAKVSGAGAIDTLCLWVADGVELGFAFGGATPEDPRGHIRTMLTEIVTYA